MHFNIDGPFWQFLTLCTRYFILNVLFVLTVIPVITVGPARAALYSTVFAYSDNEDINLGREYISRFKREFVRAIGSSVIFTVLAAAIAFAIVFWASLNTSLSDVTLPILVIATVVVATTFEYYFPLQARYQNTFAHTWKSALLLPWRVFGSTLILLAIDAAAGTIFVFVSYIRIAFILLGFSWLAYAKSLIFLRIFKRVDTHHDTPQTPDSSLPTASLQQPQHT